MSEREHDCDHICPEAGCDLCGDPTGRCGHTGWAWPAIDETGWAIPCVEVPGKPCLNVCAECYPEPA